MMLTDHVVRSVTMPPDAYLILYQPLVPVNDDALMVVFSTR